MRCRKKLEEQVSFSYQMHVGVKTCQINFKQIYLQYLLTVKFPPSLTNPMILGIELTILSEVRLDVSFDLMSVFGGMVPSMTLLA